MVSFIILIFWFSKVNRAGTRLSELAKTGTVSDVTRLVNGGQNGLADRTTRYNALADFMGLI
jgi:predicted chitinase